MRASDVRNLIRFNTRMGMYVCPSNRANVVSFLHGYEYAASEECNFISLISQHVSEIHQIEPDSLGWPHQIARLAENRGLEWMDVYLMVSSEVLESELSAIEADA